MRSVGTFCAVPGVGEVTENCAVQSSCRTSARASLKVGSDLRYPQVPQPAERWILVGQVPAVVSQAQFEEVQAKLATNRPFAQRNNTARHYLLRALVSCGRCGLACTGRGNGRYAYYSCSGKQPSTYSRHPTCFPARHTPAGQLDELVWADLCALLSEPEPLAMAVARAHGGAWLPQELLARREALRRRRRVDPAPTAVLTGCSRGW